MGGEGREGIMKFWIFFWGGGHRKTGLFFGVNSKHSMAFSLGQDTELEYLLGLLTFNYF